MTTSPSSRLAEHALHILHLNIQTKSEAVSHRRSLASRSQAQRSTQQDAAHKQPDIHGLIVSNRYVERTISNTIHLLLLSAKLTSPVFTFSTILFLSGYILQQQTVHELHAILRPVQTQTAVHTPVQDSSPTAFDWSTVAYVQIISRHEDVCAAAVIFAELAKHGSRADRVLLYPRAWEREERSMSDEDRRVRERSMRLLRKVVTRYGIVMKAVETEGQSVAGGAAADTTIPVQKLFSLTEWQTLAYLAPAGVVYNTSALDEVFALDMTSPQLDFWAEETDATRQLVATLIRPNPSTDQHVEMLRRPGMDMMMVAKLLGPESRSDRYLFGSTGSLRNVLVEDRNESEPWAAYMRFTDPSIPGPEYDIPQELWDSSRPTTKQERLVWERMYVAYREQRMAVCGLEVEPIPKTMLETVMSPETSSNELELT